MEIAASKVCRTLFFLILPILILVAANEASAQASRQVTAIERRVQTMDRQAAEYERDNMGRDGKKPQVDAKRAREIRNEISEDLNGLQTAYNEIVIALQDKTGPAELFIRTQTESVNKRSARLKTNLAFPKPIEDQEKQVVSAAVNDTPRKVLRSIAKLIHDLITNPIFESTEGLDVKLAAKASSDLDALIQSTSK